MQWQPSVALPQKVRLVDGLFDERDQTLSVKLRPHYLNYISGLPLVKARHFQWQLGLELNKRTEIQRLSLIHI